MALMRRLAVLGAAAEAARRYARNNPSKARELTDKAATFVDQRTKGKYSRHIDGAKRQLAEYGGFAGPDVVPGSVEVHPPTNGQPPRPTPYQRG